MQSRERRLRARSTPTTTNAVWNEIPFADMKAMIDPPTEDVTGPRARADGHGTATACDFGRAQRAREFVPQHAARRRELVGPLGRQLHLRHVVGARRACARSARTCRRRTCGRAVDWLAARQNADGGFGARPIASYDDESLAGRGESTPSQTAWAVMGLLAGDGPRDVIEPRHRVAAADAERATARGSEKPWTGTGFPRHFYLRYHMYRHYFPVMALGQYRAKLGEQS